MEGGEPGQLEWHEVAALDSRLHPLSDGPTHPGRALQRVPVHAGANEVVSDFGRFSQDPPSVWRESGLATNSILFC